MCGKTHSLARRASIRHAKVLHRTAPVGLFSAVVPKLTPRMTSRVSTPWRNRREGGALTNKNRKEPDNFDRVGLMLSILKSKARRAVIGSGEAE